MQVEEIIKLGNEAIKLNFATGWTNRELECDSQCENCPSHKACEYLAVDKDFNLYVTNYKNIVLPELDNLGIELL